MVRLKVSDLETGYGENKVLKGVNFDLRPEDFTGVIGPNGCGKSTLVRAITGVIPIWKGEVWLDGKKISDMNRKELACKVAVVPQRAHVSFPFTVREIVEMGRNPFLGRFEGMGGSHDSIVEDALSKVGIEELGDRSVRGLSGGEYQRMLVARALAQEPELMLLDEATSHLDIGHRIEVMELMKRLNSKEGLSILTIHHDLDLAARYCGNILLMDDGGLHAKGKPSDVLTPNHLRAVYGVEAEVHRNPRDDSLYVVPITRKEIKTTKDTHVHVVCGGGTGGKVMKKLVEEGYEVTAGVLNAMDSDMESVDFLNVRPVVEAPFSSISKEAKKENMELMKSAEAVVVTPFPIGKGNVDNIKMVEEMVDEVKQVVLMDGDDIHARDYTDGYASSILNGMKIKYNVSTVKEEEGVLRALSRQNL